MADGSFITIDGYTIHGSGSDILHIKNAVEALVETANRNPSKLLWFPTTGATDGGRKAVQLVRIRPESSIQCTIVSEGPLDDFVDSMESFRNDLIERFMREAKAEMDGRNPA